MAINFNSINPNQFDPISQDELSRDIEGSSTTSPGLTTDSDGNVIELTADSDGDDRAFWEARDIGSGTRWTTETGIDPLAQSGIAGVGDNYIDSRYDSTGRPNLDFTDAELALGSDYVDPGDFDFSGAVDSGYRFVRPENPEGIESIYAPQVRQSWRDDWDLGEFREPSDYEGDWLTPEQFEMASNGEDFIQSLVIEAEAAGFDDVNNYMVALSRSAEDAALFESHTINLNASVAALNEFGELYRFQRSIAEAERVAENGVLTPAQVNENALYFIGDLLGSGLITEEQALAYAKDPGILFSMFENGVFGLPAGPSLESAVPDFAYDDADINFLQPYVATYNDDGSISGYVPYQEPGSYVDGNGALVIGEKVTGADGIERTIIREIRPDADQYGELDADGNLVVVGDGTNVINTVSATAEYGSGDILGLYPFMQDPPGSGNFVPYVGPNEQVVGTPPNQSLMREDPPGTWTTVRDKYLYDFTLSDLSNVRPEDQAIFDSAASTSVEDALSNMETASSEYDAAKDAYEAAIEDQLNGVNLPSGFVNNAQVALTEAERALDHATGVHSYLSGEYYASLSSGDGSNAGGIQTVDMSPGDNSGDGVTPGVTTPTTPNPTTPTTPNPTTPTPPTPPTTPTTPNVTPPIDPTPPTTPTTPNVTPPIDPTPPTTPIDPTPPTTPIDPITPTTPIDPTPPTPPITPTTPIDPTPPTPPITPTTPIDPTPPTPPITPTTPIDPTTPTPPITPTTPIDPTTPTPPTPPTLGPPPWANDVSTFVTPQEDLPPSAPSATPVSPAISHADGAWNSGASYAGNDELQQRPYETNADGTPDYTSPILAPGETIDSETGQVVASYLYSDGITRRTVVRNQLAYEIAPQDVVGFENGVETIITRGNELGVATLPTDGSGNYQLVEDYLRSGGDVMNFFSSDESSQYSMDLAEALRTGFGRSPTWPNMPPGDSHTVISEAEFWALEPHMRDIGPHPDDWSRSVMYRVEPGTPAEYRPYNLMAIIQETPDGFNLVDGDEFLDPFARQRYDELITVGGVSASNSQRPDHSVTMKPVETSPGEHLAWDFDFSQSIDMQAFFFDALTEYVNLTDTPIGSIVNSSRSDINSDTPVAFDIHDFVTGEGIDGWDGIIESVNAYAESENLGSMGDASQLTTEHSLERLALFVSVLLEPIESRIMTEARNRSNGYEGSTPLSLFYEENFGPGGNGTTITTPVQIAEEDWPGSRLGPAVPNPWVPSWEQPFWQRYQEEAIDPYRGWVDPRGEGYGWSGFTIGGGPGGGPGGSPGGSLSIGPGTFPGSYAGPFSDADQARFGSFLSQMYGILAPQSLGGDSIGDILSGIGDIGANPPVAPPTPTPTAPIELQIPVGGLAGGGYIGGLDPRVPGMSSGGYIGGIDGGMDDTIPAITDGNSMAALSSGEFVIPADVVSHLGDGNNQNGASKLYQLLDEVRSVKTGMVEQPAPMDDGIVSNLIGYGNG